MNLIDFITFQRLPLSLVYLYLNHLKKYLISIMVHLKQS